MNKTGYAFKLCRGVRRLARAYADDISFITHNARNNQKACDKTIVWLLWTVTMAAKPRKCVSLAMKQFDKRAKREVFVPVQQQKYSVFDPRLTIDGKIMRFLGDPALKNDFKKSHFKFLGRWIHSLLNEIREKVRSEIFEAMKIVSECQVWGFKKLWLYQFYI